MKKLRLQFRKNRRGDIPTTILVLGVFVICSLALLNFYLVGLNDSNIFEGVVLVGEIVKFSDDIIFYKNFGKNPLEFAEKSRLIKNSDLNIEGELEDGNYNVTGSLSEKEYLFFEGKRMVYVEYKFPS